MSVQKFVFEVPAVHLLYSSEDGSSVTLTCKEFINFGPKMDDLGISATTAAKCFVREVYVMPEAICIRREQSSLWVVVLCGLEGPDVSNEDIMLKSKPSKKPAEADKLKR
jgi:hypothetical protein